MYQKSVKATKARTLARFRNTIKNFKLVLDFINIGIIYIKIEHFTIHHYMMSVNRLLKVK